MEKFFRSRKLTQLQVVDEKGKTSNTAASTRDLLELEGKNGGDEREGKSVEICNFPFHSEAKKT